MASPHRARRRRLTTLLTAALLFGAACAENGEETSPRGGSLEQGETAEGESVDWEAVEQELGRQAEVTGDVHRFSFPRSDLTVRISDVVLKPGFALGSYAAFVPSGDRVAVMGDLVLTEDEVNRVMSKLQEGGLELTALHNHLLREEPKVMYMHYEGEGDAVKLARALRVALEASATPLTSPGPSETQAPEGLDTKRLDEIIEHAGKASGGLYKYSIGREEEVTMGRPATGGGLTLTPAMGVATVINFQPLGGGRAAITGDFALTGTEVANVAAALREAGIEVTATHSHMTEDQPHLYYMHFYATGEATTLAEGVRAGLDKTNVEGK